MLVLLFSFFFEQEKHHRDVHASFDDNLCQHCGKGFKLKKYLQIHIINSHTAKQDKPFPCHLCEKGFNNHMKLTQHLVRLESFCQFNVRLTIVAKFVIVTLFL